MNVDLERDWEEFIKYNVIPDIVIYGKSLGMVIQLMQWLVKIVMKSEKSTFISSTFWSDRIGQLLQFQL